MHTILTSIQRLQSESEVPAHWCQRALDLVNRSGERCLFRDHFDDGHITGSLFVFNPDHTKVLLHHHLRFDRWQQFGGHADGEKDIQGTALREFEEEASPTHPILSVSDLIGLQIHDIPDHGDEPQHYHYDMRYGAVISEEASFVPEEGAVGAISWIDMDRVGEVNEEGEFITELVRLRDCCHKHFVS